MDTIKELQYMTGGMVIFLEAENEEKLMRFYEDKRIVIGTHGTALSTILNFYHPEFGCRDFLRIIDWMPYIIELDFEEERLLSMKEHCYIEKEFKNR